MASHTDDVAFFLHILSFFVDYVFCWSWACFFAHSTYSWYDIAFFCILWHVLLVMEVADVRKNLLKLRFFQAHPLSNWQHKILEGKLGNQTSTTSILFCSRKQRLWKRIEDLATLDASTSNDIVSSLETIWFQSKLRLKRKNNPS